MSASAADRVNLSRSGVGCRVHDVSAEALRARFHKPLPRKRVSAASNSRNFRYCRIARTAVPADNPEPSARGTSELKTRSASAFLEQDEARLGQHPLLARGQAAAGLACRQVADYLNDLDQIP